MLPASAGASCIYNKAYYPIETALYCGGACQNEWTIHVDDHKCRPGKGGHVNVTVLDPEADNRISDWCEVEVDKHGWVSVQQHGKHVTVISKHKDGSHRQECHLKVEY